MIHPTYRFGIAGLVVALLALSAPAQEPSTPPQTAEEALHQMSDLAGVIFVGEVIAIRHRPGQQGASGIVEIDFRIDQAVRGCNAGNTYILREWAGLWEGGDERYRPGQRLLMLLHAPGPTGLTSPVGRTNGVMPVHAETTSPLATAATESAPLTVDLRWVTTRLLHRVPSSSPPPPSTAQGLVTADTQDSSSDIPDQPRQVPVSDIVGMFRSWQQAAP